LSINEAWGIGGTSEDVLHSFSLKEFGFHTDCIPGKHISHTVFFLTNSVVIITCQELCGYRHAGITLGVILD
jgi:heme/copper-type cytochrome/quinol oxidase subunit 2